MDRRTFVGYGAASLLAAGIAPSSLAAVVAGRDFVPLGQPLTPETGAKIEVLEFFWYGCPHCFDLEPLLNKWVKKLPADAEFRRTPAIFRDSWVPGAKLFYALESLGQLEKLHGAAFDAIHVEKKKPDDEKVLIDWVASKGVDRKKVEETFGSFSVQSKVARAQQITRQSRIQGVPAVIIDGKYMTSGSLTGTHEAMFPVLDELIAKARGERGKK